MWWEGIVLLVGIDKNFGFRSNEKSLKGLKVKYDIISSTLFKINSCGWMENGVKQTGLITS